MIESWSSGIDFSHQPGNMDPRLCRDELSSNQIKMHCEDTELQARRVNFETKEQANQSARQQIYHQDQYQFLTTIPPPPKIFAPDLSPTPSSEHSTLTSSFLSIGQQFNQASSILQNVRASPSYQTNSEHSEPKAQQIIALDNNTQVQQSTPPNHFRHSSCSIDHKSLNLTRFDINQLGLSGPIQYICPHHQRQQQQSHLDKPVVHFQFDPQQQQQRGSALNTNSFRLKNRGAIQTNRRYPPLGATSKRCSVNLGFHYSSPSSPRSMSSFQRHQSTPVPPPRPPSRQLSLQDQVKSESSQQMAQRELKENQQQQQRSNDNQINLNLPETTNQATTNLLLQQHQQQHHGTDSLDNIQMIVDEVNTSFSPTNEMMNASLSEQGGIERFMFMTSDEPYKMSTMKPALKQTQAGINMPPIGKRDQSLDNKEQHGKSYRQERKSSLATNNTSQSSNGNFLSGVEHAVHFDDLNMQQTYEDRTGNNNYNANNNRDQSPPNGVGINPIDRDQLDHRLSLIYDDECKYDNLD